MDLLKFGVPLEILTYSPVLCFESKHAIANYQLSQKENNSVNCKLLKQILTLTGGTLTGLLPYLIQKGNPGKFIRTSEFQELFKRTKHALNSLLMLKASGISNPFIMAYYKIGCSFVLRT